ncbi:MAG: NAD-dependent epimerase/dehydratase family protein [Spirulinaceae cyanobacterium]
MTAKRIFMTGASGCIGHYLAEALIQETDHELFLLVRTPDKLQIDTLARPGVHVLQADLREIERFRDLLQTIDVAILVATAWGGSGEVFDINVVKTIRLMNLLDPAKCEQVLYFSTASILDRDNELLTAAGHIGTGYIRSKYDCFRQLSRLAIAPKIVALFPTLVIGGDQNKPKSHLSGGLPGVVKWSKLIRFFKADGSFHFIHARDIAQVVLHLVEHPRTKEGLLENTPEKIVLGQKAITVDGAVEEISAYFDQKIYFRIPLKLWLANIIITLFRIQMEPWDRFCINYRHFTYQNPVNPDTYGKTSYCPTLSDMLKVTGIPPARSVQLPPPAMDIPKEEV